MYPCSGSGAWEAAFVNTLSPGDTVLMVETGQFATLWRDMAVRLGLQVDFIPGDWRHGVDAALIGEKLAADRAHAIKAVAVVHNETSTGVTSDIPAVRRAMDAAGHPALLLVDAVSSLGSIDYRHEEWRVDVTVSSSQKGMMLPPGMGFNAISDQRARRVEDRRGCRAPTGTGSRCCGTTPPDFFPTTPAINLLLRPARSGAHARGGRPRERVRAPPALRRGDATRGHGVGARAALRAARGVQRRADRGVMPDGHDADAFRKVVLERFDMSLGAGLGKLKGKVFRIGHLGDFNDLMLAGTLGGVEMGLAAAGVPFTRGGVTAALEYLAVPVLNAARRAAEN